MYAVIKSGGKQYQVRPGDTIRVEKIDAGEGAAISLDQVLMIADGADVAVGAPLLEGATVPATVKAHGRPEDQDPEVQAAQAESQAHGASPSLHGTEDHRHQRAAAGRRGEVSHGA